MILKEINELIAKYSSVARSSNHCLEDKLYAVLSTVGLLWFLGCQLFKLIPTSTLNKAFEAVSLEEIPLTDGSVLEALVEREYGPHNTV